MDTATVYRLDGAEAWHKPARFVARTRKKRGWSVRELARKAEVSPSTVQFIERRQCGTLDMCARLLAALGCSVKITIEGAPE